MQIQIEILMKILGWAKSLKQKPRWTNNLHKICLNFIWCNYLWSHHNLNLFKVLVSSSITGKGWRRWFEEILIEQPLAAFLAPSNDLLLRGLKKKIAQVGCCKLHFWSWLMFSPNRTFQFTSISLQSLRKQTFQNHPSQ